MTQQKNLIANLLITLDSFLLIVVDFGPKRTYSIRTIRATGKGNTKHRLQIQEQHAGNVIQRWLIPKSSIHYRCLKVLEKNTDEQKEQQTNAANLLISLNNLPLEHRRTHTQHILSPDQKIQCFQQVTSLAALLTAAQLKYPMISMTYTIQYTEHAAQPKKLYRTMTQIEHTIQSVNRAQQSYRLYIQTTHIGYIAAYRVQRHSTQSPYIVQRLLAEVQISL